MAVDRRRLLALLAGVAFVLLPLSAQPVGAVTGQPLTAPVTPTPTPSVGQSPTPSLSPSPSGTRAGGQQSGTRGGQQPDSRTATSPCRPGTPPNAPPTTAYDNNQLLGPAQALTADPVGPLLGDYKRFGALTQQEFLDQYTNAAQKAYVYPPAGGFVVGSDGSPVKAAQTLLPGYRLDRFGFPGGAYLAPLGTPFGSRSLPPANLSTPETAPLANYHVYCVLKPFTVDSGPVAPWFAQPGMGTQFKLEQRYLPEAGGQLSITWLIENGYLVEEDLTTRPHGQCGATAGATIC
ncbi:TNT domain-containing protein [Micromonospora echinospora]|uniref:TNT domain-containing protein n=1 Tax=Micromonospora echinospora TaxID=1877 RepID=UPI0033F4882E